MPFKSKAQMREFFVLEGEGKMKKGTAEKFAHETPNLKSLPQHVKKSKKKRRIGILRNR